MSDMIFPLVIRLCEYHPRHVNMALCELCIIIDGFLKLYGEKGRLWVENQ